MKRALAISVAIAALGMSALASAQSNPQTRVVVHVTESNPQKWNMVLNNVANLQQDLGKGKVTIEIVTHGPGIDMFKAESAVGARLAQALDSNVILAACENTMRNAKVEKADMYGGVSFVPSGVTHIIQRESQGWFYLRP
jgi:intracellular sulfur oxidation DsrE/DsrF family protein